jgi:hypothetical protein
VAKRIELKHDRSFDDLLDLRREVYRLRGPISIEPEMFGDSLEIIQNGPVGFLSISSPQARTEICTWRGKHAIIWDARWLEFALAFAQLHMILPGNYDKAIVEHWRTQARENLTKLFFAEQLTLCGDEEAGVALSLARELANNGLTANGILDSMPLIHDSNYEKVLRFAEDSLLHVTLMHEWVHLGFRLGVVRHRDVAPELVRSLEDYIETVRQAGQQHLANFRGEERQKEDAILNEMCRSLLVQGTSDASIEEMYCDTFAASLYARMYVAPRVDSENDVTYFLYGLWVVLSLLNAFFVFDKLAWLASTLVSKKGWNENAFSGSARAREGITSHVYQSASKNWIEKSGKPGAARVLASARSAFAQAESKLYQSFLTNFAWTSEFAHRSCWTDLIARAAGEVAAVGGVDAARAEVQRYLGWPA